MVTLYAAGVRHDPFGAFPRLRTHLMIKRRPRRPVFPDAIAQYAQKSYLARRIAGPHVRGAVLGTCGTLRQTRARVGVECRGLKGSGLHARCAEAEQR